MEKLTKDFIREGNKLISQYMYPNWVHPKDQDENWKQQDVTPLIEMCRNSYSVMAHLLMEEYELLAYHKSYNSLIPVIKQIQNFDHKLKKESRAWIEYYSMETLVSYAEIEKVYDSVVKFIKAKNEGDC